MGTQKKIIIYNDEHNDNYVNGDRRCVKNDESVEFGWTQLDEWLYLMSSVANVMSNATKPMVLDKNIMENI